MIVFPNCKINLGLRILRKREDGFHDLDTAFFPVPVTDALEIVTGGDALSFTSSGISIDNNSNTCTKAYELLKRDFPQLPGLHMHLHKNIPVGAGLGGGSADGAFALKLLNGYFNLNISEEKLLDYSLQIGSDCPFFIKNTPCIASGRGEILEPVSLSLKGFIICLVNPGIHINTGWAFSQITPAIPPISVKEIIAQPTEKWKDLLKNDFENPVFEKYPEIGDIKEKLYSQGAVYAAMSGSGSTVFGIFITGSVPALSFPETYRVICADC